MRSRIILLYGTCAKFAKAIGVGDWRISEALSGERPLSSDEVPVWLKALKVEKIEDLYPEGTVVKLWQRRRLNKKSPPAAVAVFRRRRGNPMPWMYDLIYEKHKTLTGLGEALGGVSHSALSDIFRGVALATTIEKAAIVKALGCDPKMMDPGYSPPVPEVVAAPKEETTSSTLSVPMSDGALAKTVESISDGVEDLEDEVSSLRESVQELMSEVKELSRTSEAGRKLLSDLMVRMVGLLPTGPTQVDVPGESLYLPGSAGGNGADLHGLR